QEILASRAARRGRRHDFHSVILLDKASQLQSRAVRGCVVPDSDLNVNAFLREHCFYLLSDPARAVVGRQEHQNARTRCVRPAAGGWPVIMLPKGCGLAGEHRETTP